MSLLPTTQAYSLPDDHCRIILQSTLAISHFWFKAHCWNIQQSMWHLWHTRNSFCPLSSVLHWNVTGIRTIYPDLSFICSQRSLTFCRRRKKDQQGLSVCVMEEQNENSQRVAGRVFSPAEETDKNTHRYNKRYPSDMTQLCHYLRLCGETTVFWGYCMELHVPASTALATAIDTFKQGIYVPLTVS